MRKFTASKEDKRSAAEIKSKEKIASEKIASSEKIALDKTASTEKEEDKNVLTRKQALDVATKIGKGKKVDEIQAIADKLQGIAVTDIKKTSWWDKVKGIFSSEDAELDLAQFDTDVTQPATMDTGIPPGIDNMERATNGS